MNNFNFTESLVKGKIAETIFEQMLRNAQYKKENGEWESVFTVLHFGYEHVLPELAKNKEIKKGKNVTLDAIRTAPDFAVVNNKTKKVNLIEVKYRTHRSKKDTLKVAKKMEESWITAKLFLATPEGFYFDNIKNIIKNNGEIKKLVHPNITENTQKIYLDLLIKYEINPEK